MIVTGRRCRTCGGQLLVERDEFGRHVVACLLCGRPDTRLQISAQNNPGRLQTAHVPER